MFKKIYFVLLLLSFFLTAFLYEKTYPYQIEGSDIKISSKLPFVRRKEYIESLETINRDKLLFAFLNNLIKAKEQEIVLLRHELNQCQSAK